MLPPTRRPSLSPMWFWGWRYATWLVQYCGTWSLGSTFCSQSGHFWSHPLHLSTFAPTQSVLPSHAWHCVFLRCESTSVGRWLAVIEVTALEAAAETTVSCSYVVLELQQP